MKKVSPTALGKELGLDKPQRQMLDAMECVGLIEKEGPHYKITAEGQKWGGENLEKSVGGQPSGQWKTVWGKRVLDHPALRKQLKLVSFSS